MIALALPLGVICAFLALALLRLISFFTNLFFFQEISLVSRGPAQAHVGAFVLVIPIIGGFIVGLMARYGSDKIRGHGIPEAIEAILLNGARVQPKVAILKPLSAAIAIGSGGPFGAEGPIIMTGGSVGSLIASVLPPHQFGAQDATGRRSGGRHVGYVRLARRRLPPCRGVAAVRVEATQPLARRRRQPCRLLRSVLLAGQRPAFPDAGAGSNFTGPDIMLLCCAVGLSAGVLRPSAHGDGLRVRRRLRTSADPLDVVADRSAVSPSVLAASSSRERSASATTRSASCCKTDWRCTTIIGVLIVKSLIWSISLGSGTSGGVLAPLLHDGRRPGRHSKRTSCPMRAPDSGHW